MNFTATALTSLRMVSLTGSSRVLAGMPPDPELLAKPRVKFNRNVSLGMKKTLTIA